ncbi:GNAT family N-acetyltransferase [Psychromicrobium lacuslunae]|uniref:Acetyltransferase n=1 Tax=Psychromicrobium lacuslunae TaxID=1618207 RepID=A0A0D4BWZ0_9MICC|nr:GNAT family N-acetyltransferase [Psychromicrobium lacuslunae]AJT40838.1 acetyltransferase [Psychromicrobium lacuslunae]
MTFDENYQIQRFPAARPGEPGFEQAVEWIRAVNHGFHQPKRTLEQITTALGVRLADDREQLGVYQRGSVAEHSFPAERPVATFGTLRKDVNIGFGKMLPALLVTAVTVRASHRRRGILSRVMREELGRAQQAGLPLAALNASEAAIYRRFGFGVSTKERKITVDVGPKFKLNHTDAGRVESVPRQVLLELAAQIFASWHAAQPGSVGRSEGYRYQAAGMGGWGNEDDDNVLAALHYDAAGVIDGYVSYRFLGWDVSPGTFEIVDFVTANEAAYLALWGFLASNDLVERVSWATAPPENPLEWALEDRRCVRLVDEKDMLWLRILDVVAALEGREYSTDGELTLEVHDRLGFGSGSYRLSVAGGAVQVIQLDPGTEGSGSQAAVPSGDADLSLDVADLASIYLGGVLPSTLLAAGRILEHRAGAALLAQRMFAVEKAPFCASHF